MKHDNFPQGWDESQVKRAIVYYETQTEEEAVAEDEAGVAPSDTVMNVPRELVSKVRELIAKHHAE
jgi:hypothetical protein